MDFSIVLGRSPQVNKMDSNVLTGSSEGQYLLS
jgi:hypothetical protein